MKQEQKVLMELGSKATVFGLGLLAAKKLRPYAKYFIIGGVAITALPGVMAAVEQIKAKRSEEQLVEEVVLEEVEGCCEEVAATEDIACEDEAPCCQDKAEDPCCEEEKEVDVDQEEDKEEQPE